MFSSGVSDLILPHVTKRYAKRRVSDGLSGLLTGTDSGLRQHWQGAIYSKNSRHLLDVLTSFAPRRHTWVACIVPRAVL